MNFPAKDRFGTFHPVRRWSTLSKINWKKMSIEFNMKEGNSQVLSNIVSHLKLRNLTNLLLHITSDICLEINYYFLLAHF